MVLSKVLDDNNNNKIEFKRFFPEHSFDQKAYSLVFTCPNQIFDNIEAKLESQHPINFKNKIFECNITAHFNLIEISFSTENKRFIKGLSVKKEKIENMSLDILYVYGLFYVNVMNRVDDAQLRVRCIELKKIFIELDTIWKLDKVKLHGYNKKKAKKILKARLKYHLADVASNLIKEEEADNQDEVLFKETFVSLNDYIDYIKSKNETNSRVNDKQVEELTVIIKLMKLKNF